MTESCSAPAPDVAPGDRMFADTAASIGSAAFALAAMPALTGAAMSSAASTLTSRSSSDVGIDRHRLAVGQRRRVLGFELLGGQPVVGLAHDSTSVSTWPMITVWSASATATDSPSGC